MTTTLTPEQLDAFGAELDAIRQRIVADLGEERRDVHPQRREGASSSFEVAGRAMFYLPPLWPLAVASLSASPRSSTTWRSATT